MKMQPIRVGVASIIAATVIGAGFTAPTAGAAPAVKTNSTVQTYVLKQDAIKEIANKYGIDLSKITFNGGKINCPPGSIGTITKPGTGTITKPGTGTTTKPDTGTTTKPSTGTDTTTKPSTGTGNTNTGTPDMSAFQSQVIDLVNQERAKAGLSAVKSDALLTKVATEKARDMDVNNYFSHTSPTYGSPFDMMRSFGVTYSYAGENIASGQRTPQEVMTAWMNSSGHRANILSKNFTKIGVGYVNGEWVQMFIG
ncbi:CAP domain-containing protein [Paenibacillus alkaliterrae]|uniref:CAP domain-containing protein n=1 Tax=Paenibacillus alkaliterrae TaxID=320909 RepID=UPI001F1B50A7|nr:CAP domain-containing protein [Paenibacillus alkaliterrae]MCF2937849.1 CAP domain-containing protein [Paenibacillus alkaliterrae]